MSELWDSFVQVGVDLNRLLGSVLQLALRWSLLIAWVAWWLFGVDWKKTWKVLAMGAWLPLVLLLVISALVWSQIAPAPCSCLGFTTVANFWWQLGAVGLLAALTLFCGWLQGVFGWGPAEISLEPLPEAHHDAGHGHH